MIDLTGKVAIVTGAGRGLGRAHALALARRGARVVVNDLGGALDGRGGSATAAQAVVAEIVSAGGEALANDASVVEYEEVERMVAEATGRWGGVDILVANAGILRDKTFAKMALDDFRAVLEVHVMGSVNCAKAVWRGMRDRNFGRIILTTSSTGLFGNFGQSNYGTAKMGLVGLMNTLALEGARNNIRVNCLSPSAATRMLDGLKPEDELAALDPAMVAPAVVALSADNAPTKTILCAGAGTFEVAQVYLSDGLHLGSGPEVAEQILARFAQIVDPAGQCQLAHGPDQSAHEMSKAGR